MLTAPSPRTPAGKVTEFKGNNGHEAKFASNGRVKEVHSGNMTITHGPGNMRRSVVENRETHTRFVAEGHGRGYIEHRYEYGGHAYYARGYYYHGGYYRNYFHPYYYGGVQLYGYAPAYFYPTAYYGWAYKSLARSRTLRMGLGWLALVRLLRRLLPTPIPFIPPPPTGWRIT